MRSSKTWMAAGVALVFCAGMVVNAEAAEGWDYRITPYAFLPAVDIDSTVAGQTTAVDESFGDLLDNFDVFGLSIRGEAWKGVWGGVVDFYWADLDGKFGPDDSVKVKIENWYVDLLGGYRWLFPGTFGRPASADVTFGLRYHSLKQTIGTAQAPRDLGGSDNFVDIMIGARYIQPLAEKWLVMIRGDIGGFGLTDGTEIKLGGTGEIPDADLPAIDRTPKAEPFGTEAQLAEGVVDYARNCAVCHGPLAVSSGVLPDLSWSAISANPDSWKGVVLEGHYSANGMVSFSDYLSEDDVEAIRAYVLAQAHAAAAAEGDGTE